MILFKYFGISCQEKCNILNGLEVICGDLILLAVSKKEGRLQSFNYYCSGYFEELTGRKI